MLRHWRSIENVKFVETTVFTRRVVEAMPDDDYVSLQEALLRRPAQGSLIKDTGGLRKLRWGDEARGKSGAFRIICYWHPQRELFLMLYLYRKNEQKDLSAEQKRILARVVREEFK